MNASGEPYCTNAQSDQMSSARKGRHWHVVGNMATMTGRLRERNWAAVYGDSVTLKRCANRIVQLLVSSRIFFCCKCMGLYSPRRSTSFQGISNKFRESWCGTLPNIRIHSPQTEAVHSLFSRSEILLDRSIWALIRILALDNLLRKSLMVCSDVVSK